jgi:cysteine desulfurase
MHPYLEGQFGNPSSLHLSGRIARQAVDRAREQVARLINADPDEILFTSGGTESDNIALKSVAESFEGCHIVTSAIEHPAILSTCKYLEGRGVEVTYLPVNPDGIVQPEVLERSIRPNTGLASIMAANNVIGSLQPVSELAAICAKRGVLFHTDAVQAVGKLPIDVKSQPIGMLSLSGHKINGPKGIGALFVKKGTPLHPLIHGGGQEHDLRSGTENVPGIVGLGLAAEIARGEMSEESSRLVQLRESIIDGVQAAIPGSYLIGHRYRRLPGHICLGFSGREGEAIRILLELDDAGIEVSSGSACSSNHASEPSYIMLALGFDPVRARGSLRITLGRFNTEEDAGRLLDVLPSIVAGRRS